MQVKTTKNYKGIGDDTKYLCMCDNKLFHYSNPTHDEGFFYCNKCNKMFDDEMIECHGEYEEIEITKNKKTRRMKLINNLISQGYEKYIIPFNVHKYNTRLHFERIKQYNLNKGE